MIKVTFPDGAIREYEAGITTKEIAESISKSLAKKALAGKWNGELIDLDRAIDCDGTRPRRCPRVITSLDSPFNGTSDASPLSKN